MGLLTACFGWSTRCWGGGRTAAHAFALVNVFTVLVLNELLVFDLIFKSQFNNGHCPVR